MATRRKPKNPPKKKEPKLLTKEGAIEELTKFRQMLAQAQNNANIANRGIARMEGYIAALNDMEGDNGTDSETSDGSGSSSPGADT
jgi:hypothetical protein